MTRAQFKIFLRASIPSANVARIDNATLELLLDKAVRNVNNMGKVLTKSDYFNAAADVREYVITSEVPDFVLIGESGIWYNTGTAASPYYKELEGCDKPYLNVKIPNWHVQAAGNPLYAIVESNRFTIHPKPSATLTDAFFLPDYVYAPTPMTADSHYPWSGSTTEIKQLEVLDDCIIAYCRWILGLSVGEDENKAGLITKKEYEETVTRTTQLLNRRPDFRSNRDFRLKGRMR